MTPFLPPRAAVPALAQDTAPDDADIPKPDQFPPEEEPQPDDAERMEADKTTGGIRVYVRTARGAMPVPGAIVTITRDTGGMRPELIAVQTADDSGDCAEVTVPAPASTADQRRPAYFSYDITVSAAGFYREHSAGVPVFAGVVSVQNFDMIPLPAGHDDPYADDLTVYNDMPAPD